MDWNSQNINQTTGKPYEKKINTERGYFMRSNAPGMDVDFRELLPVRQFIDQLIMKSPV